MQAVQRHHGLGAVEVLTIRRARDGTWTWRPRIGWRSASGATARTTPTPIPSQPVLPAQAGSCSLIDHPMLQSIDWLWLLHPVLAVALVYPLLGMVLRLAVQTRDRRVLKAKLPPTVGRDHADLGSWLATAVVAIVLLALAVVILTAHPLAAFPGGLPRLGLIGLVLLGSGLALVVLGRVKSPAYRASFALLCWVGVITLGLQAEVYRLGDNPFEGAFWQSHFWGGAGLTGLMLFSVAGRPEISKQLRWRRLHAAANALAALIFLAQAISGSRDLLAIPISWQKPAIQACDDQRNTCPIAPAAAATP